MRVSRPVLFAAFGLFVFAGAVANPLLAMAERVWTDHIPAGPPYMKPPPPARPMSAEQQAAALEPIPPLEPLTVEPLRIEILAEITRLKAAERDPQKSALLDALGSLYGGELAGPFWVQGRSFNQKARIAVGEMGRADAYAIDPVLFNLPSMDIADSADAGRAELKMTLAVMAYAREAFGMRFEPHSISLWLDHKPLLPEPSELLPQIALAADPSEALRSLHPSHPAFEALRQAYLVATGKLTPKTPKVPTQFLDGPRRKVGGNHPRVALVPPLPTPKLPDVKTIEANMLRWRWLPRDLGNVYVWNNIPEFMTRVFKNGELIHEERIIVGQSDQQTPVFSDRMEKIVFKPQWGVPNSIKITDLLPRLRSGDTGVLERRGMKIVENGRTISPDRIRWSSTDIRYLSIVQGPSPRNPLGEMKFMFPNHHSVYMHDTTSKHLFRSSSRTFSHGCIRVRNPRKLAQVIFEDVQGWDINRIPKLLDRRAEENNEIYLDKPIAVHNVYFTLVPDGRGGFYRLTDVYRHDKRIIEAMEGKSLEWLADNDPARIHKQRVAEIERSTRYRSPSYPSPSRGQAFSNDGATFFLFGSSLGAPPPAGAKPKRKARRRTIQQAWPPLFLYD